MSKASESADSDFDRTDRDWVTTCTPSAAARVGCVEWFMVDICYFRLPIFGKCCSGCERKTLHDTQPL